MTRMKAIKLVAQELTKVEKKFPPFHTNHEGYGIIKEELDELWAEIKLRLPDAKGGPFGTPNYPLREEATHLGRGEGQDQSSGACRETPRPSWN